MPGTHLDSILDALRPQKHSNSIERVIIFKHVTVSASEPTLVTETAPKRGPRGSRGLPGGLRIAPRDPPGAPGASPGGLRSTPSASSEHPVRPKDPPGGPNGNQGAQKTPSGGFRAMVLQDFRSLSSVLEAFRTIKISCLFASKPPSLQASKCLGGMREA